MNFEVKNIEIIGSVHEKDENTSTQNMNITIGVVGCPYIDIITKRTVTYEFSNNISVAEARAGIITFAANWVITNYPNV